jgi:hypothetical protein
MSSFVRRASAAGLLILAAAVGTTVPASASPARASVAPAGSAGAAQVGAGWIGRQLSPGGDIITAGKADPSATVQAVLAFAASGVGGHKADAAITWLKKHFESYVSPGGVDDAGSLAYVILAAQAMGDNPKEFGGTGASNNLVQRLVNTQRTTGSDAGLFGAQDPTYDGAFRQGLSLMALANAGMSNAAGVTWLQDQQCSDGGWESYRSDLGTPCPAPDPGTFTGPDTNSTSLATEGLVAQGAVDTTENHAITTFFESAQNTDGGFGLIGASSQSPDPDSTGEVIQALVALGQLTNPAFTQSGGTPPTALETFQLGCSAKASHRGAYIFPGEKGPNMLASVQAVPGAAEVAFPLEAQTLRPGLPRLTCPSS